MLNENIRNLRKANGLSQEELAEKLNVVRQTVSKWENGLSVPDADMLISLSEAFKTPVGTLLGETVDETAPEDMKTIIEKLEMINLRFARAKEARRKRYHTLFIILCAAVIIIGIILFVSGSPYLDWDFSDPETAVAGTFLHGFEFVFVRLGPFALIGGMIGAILTRKKIRP